MKRRATRFLALVGFLSLILTGPLFAAPKATHWHSGRVSSAGMTGHGAKSVNGKNKNAGKQDIWWTYCISGEKEAYTAVSRISPGKAGMTIDSPVQFSVDKNRVYVLNCKGERYILRRVNHVTTKDCH